jgi:hypothetical protein
MSRTVLMFLLMRVLAFALTVEAQGSTTAAAPGYSWGFPSFCTLIVRFDSVNLTRSSRNHTGCTSTPFARIIKLLHGRRVFNPGEVDCLGQQRRVRFFVAL